MIRVESSFRQIILIGGTESTRSHVRGVFSQLGVPVLTDDTWDLDAYDSATHVFDVALVMRNRQTSFASLVRALLNANPQVAVVCIDDRVDLERALDAMRAGAQDYFTNDIEDRDLVSRVELAVQRQQLSMTAERTAREELRSYVAKTQLVDWKSMYGSKDVTQADIMIELLARTMNQEGGFMWLDLLRDGQTEIDESNVSVPKEIMELALVSAETQKKVFETVAFLSEIDKIPLESESFSGPMLIERIARNIDEKLFALCPSKRLNYSVTPYGAPIAYTVRIDFGQLSRILDELVINAVKFTPEGGAVRAFFDITNEPYAGEVLTLHIQNSARPLKKFSEGVENAVGIPYELSERVFELFYTIDPYPSYLDTEEWRDGTGLYIARKLMKRFGGWIEAANVRLHTHDAIETMVDVRVRLSIQQEDADEPEGSHS